MSGHETLSAAMDTSAPLSARRRVGMSARGQTPTVFRHRCAQAGARWQFRGNCCSARTVVLTGGARLARADGPDRLIRDDDVLPVGDAVCHALQLPLQDGVHLRARAGSCQASLGEAPGNPPYPGRPPAGVQDAGQPAPERPVRCMLATAPSDEQPSSALTAQTCTALALHSGSLWCFLF